MVRPRLVPALPSLLLFAIPLVPAGGTAQAPPAPRSPPQQDSAEVVATVEAFHGALETADSASVRELLATDATVGEGAGLETREEYLSGHMGADMAFAASLTRERELVQVTVEGDVAWVVSTSHSTGTFRGRDIDSRGAETMVLGRQAGEWRIRAIHWS